MKTTRTAMSVYTMGHNLVVVADHYTSNAALLREEAEEYRRWPYGEGEGRAVAVERLAAQFDKQAAEARAMGNALTNCDTVTFADDTITARQFDEVRA